MLLLPSAVVDFNVLLDKLEKTIKILDEKVNRNNIDEMLVSMQAGCNKLIKHYSKCNWIYCAVFILDPRFKIETFKKTAWGLEMMDHSYKKFVNILKTYHTVVDDSKENTISEQKKSTVLGKPN